MTGATAGDGADQRRVVVASVQLPPSSWDEQRDVAAVESAIADAVAAGADLVVLPELAASPYFPVMAAGDQTKSLAQTVPGRLTGRIGRQAADGGVHIALPMYQRDGSGSAEAFRNAVVLLGPDGTIVLQIDAAGRRYQAGHKLHLPHSRRPGDSFDERAHFSPGDHLGVWETGLGRIGALVCYDRRFPEAWRALRALSADIVIVPVAGSGGDTSSFFLAELRTHARENGVFVAAANKAGDEAAPTGSVTRHHGDSAIIDPYGSILRHRPATAGPGLAAASIDLGDVKRARSEFPYYDDRRLDLFS